MNCERCGAKFEFDLGLPASIMPQDRICPDCYGELMYEADERQATEEKLPREE